MKFLIFALLLTFDLHALSLEDLPSPSADPLIDLLDSHTLDQVYFLRNDDSYLGFTALHLLAVGFTPDSKSFAVRWDGAETYYLQFKDGLWAFRIEDLEDDEKDRFINTLKNFASKIEDVIIPPTELRLSSSHRERHVLEHRHDIERKIINGDFPYSLDENGDLTDLENNVVLQLRPEMKVKKAEEVDPIHIFLLKRAQNSSFDEPELPRNDTYTYFLKPVSDFEFDNIKATLFQDTLNESFSPASSYFIGKDPERMFRIHLRHMTEEQQKEFVLFLEELKNAQGQIAKTSFSISNDGQILNREGQVIVDSDPNVIHLLRGEENIEPSPIYYNVRIDEIKRTREKFMIHLQKFSQENAHYSFVVYYIFEDGQELWITSNPLSDEFTHAAKNRVRFIYEIIEE